MNLLKRELEQEIDRCEKSDEKKVKKKKKKGGFSFNDKDYSKEDDFTEDCLKNLGKFEITAYVSEGWGEFFALGGGRGRLWVAEKTVGRMFSKYLFSLVYFCLSQL